MKNIILMKKWFATYLLLVVSTLSWAYDFKVNGIYYNTKWGGNNVSVTCNGNNSYSGTVVIPSSVVYNKQNYTVTSIGERAFYGCSGLTSVTIPESVTSIGSNAFTNCFKLVKAEFASIEHIVSIDFESSGSNPLFYAHNLYIDGKPIKDIVIPEDLTDIKKYAFNGYSMHSLIISANVKTIGGGAFTGDSITKVIWLPEVLPSGSPSCAIGKVNYYSSSNYSSIVESYPTKFYYYPLLTSRFEVDGVIYVPLSTTECDVIDRNYSGNSVSLEIGPTITYKNRTLNVRNIMPYACYYDTRLENLSVTNSGYIGSYAFYGSRITQAANIANKGRIGSYAFSNISGDACFVINNTNSLADYAFSNSKFTSVTITNNVTSIGNYCFASDGIRLEASINNNGSIGKSAFSSIIGGFDAYIHNSGRLHQSCFQNSKMGVVDIGNNVTSLGDSCFKSTTFTQATIGNKVDSIGKYSFAGATGFTNIILPNNVKFMGECSFKGCTTMKNITVSRGLNEIKNGVFSGCSSLTSLFVPNTIQAIRNNVFDGCSSLKILTFEDKNGEYSLGTSGSNSPEPLFKTCGLDSVYVGGRLTYEVKNIPYSPFISHKTLRAIRFADVRQEIHPKEFQDCKNLQNVYMGATMNPIGDYAFSGCTSLARFNVGPAVKRLGAYSFNGCSALKYIDLANTDSICNNAFMGCTSLPELSIPSSAILIQNQVFKGCTALKNLYIKDRTKTLLLGINNSGTSYKGITGAGTPIFSDCPLDSVYIGGPITYSLTKASGYSPFFYNESLRSVYISNKEKTVYENEFYNCLGLKNLKLGPGVTKIEQYGFQSCIGLQHFEFASTLQTIGANAFSDCTNMKTIISHASTPPVCGAQALQDINFWECNVYVPEGAVDAYMEADQWKNFYIESYKEKATGDIDGDGEIDVADIQHIINMIVGTESSTSVADINGDDDVDVADIQAIINIIISNANVGAREMIPVSSQEEAPNADFVQYEQANYTIDVSLINNITYSAFQLKVALPRDVDITDVDFCNARMGDLSKYVKKVADGQYIIIGYSLDGSTIEGSEDVILTIQTSKPALQQVAITDVVFSTPKAAAHKLPVVEGQVTAVQDIVISSMKVVGNTISIYNSGSDTLLYIYSLDGRLVNKQVLNNGQNSFVLPKGLYVINKQKVFIGK